MPSERDVEDKIKNLFKTLPQFENIKADVPCDGKRADLVIYKDEKPYIVIEVKKESIDPTDIEVVNQASHYANNFGCEYFSTTNGKDFVLFETFRPGTSLMERKLKFFEVDEFLPKKVHGEITQGVQWMRFDDAFVKKLSLLHDSLIPEMLKSIERSLKEKKFNEEFTRWVTEQGFEYETITEKQKTNQIISNQSTYLLVNKIFFYKVLETVYPQIQGLRSIHTLDISSYLKEYFKDVLKIDYRAIFEQGFFDKIKIPPEVAKTLVGFIKELELFDFDKVESDIIGRIYEKLIPINERKHLGQYYTPPQIIELILNLTVDDPKQKILDPCCGSGGFLVGAYSHLLKLKGKSRVTTENEHQNILDNLAGIEINQFPAHLSVINLAMQGVRFRTDDIHVLVSDFFDVKTYNWFNQTYKKAHLDKKDERTATYSVFDSIVANPPYIRQEIITQKKKLQEIMKFEEANIDKTSDIYSYFFVHATQFLKNNGKLGFITSNKWLEVKYGKSLQKFLLDNHKILYVIEFDAGAFEEVLVNTCVTILQKEKDSKKRIGNRVKFVRVKKQMKNDKLVQVLEKSDKDFEDESIRLTTIPQFKLINETKWNTYLRAPQIYHKIIKNNKLIKLNQVSDVIYGLKTGCNEFFILDEDKTKNWDIEKEFLSPCISGPKDAIKIELTNKDLSKYILLVNKGKSEITKTKAIRYIEFGEEKKYNKRPTVDNRNRWYDLGQREPYQILFPYLMWTNVVFYHNNCEAIASDNFHEIKPNNKKDLFVILGLLNSSITQLICEIIGRSYGGGVLQLKV